MVWFEGWFNSKYYHILYKNRDDSEARSFIDNLNNHLQFNPFHKILDLACGKGRHSIYLNSKGLDVIGADLSAESIRYAKKYENDRLHFFIHDMRKPMPPNQFDFVLNLFTSFGYFDNPADDLLTIRAVHQSLKEKGRLIIDFFNAEKTIQDLIPYEERTINKITFHISKKIENGFIIKTVNFKVNHKDFEFTEKVKALYLIDFENLFQQAGFLLQKLYGSYQLDEFDLNHSERLIMIASKTPPSIP